MRITVYVETKEGKRLVWTSCLPSEIPTERRRAEAQGYRWIGEVA